jgi:hypothetical protein
MGKSKKRKETLRSIAFRALNSGEFVRELCYPQEQAAQAQAPGQSLFAPTAGPITIRPQPTELRIGGLRFAGPHFAGPHFARPHFAGPHFAGPHFAGLHFAGPHIAGPHTRHGGAKMSWPKSLKWDHQMPPMSRSSFKSKRG